jgi:Flp pilus assembly protein TadD
MVASSWAQELAMGRDPQAPQRAEVDALLRDGIRHAKEGERERARALLRRALELDDQRVAGWLWMSAVVDSVEDRSTCLQNVLTLDPEHRAARRGLAALRAVPNTASGAASAGVPEEKPEDAAYASPLWSEPPDPLLCPYCAAPTGETDRRCPSCRGDLWVRTRRREAHSLWLWNLIGIRFLVGVLGVVAPLLVLALLAQRLAGELDPFLLLPHYVGLPNGAAQGVESAALEIVPRSYLVPFPLVGAYSLALALGQYARWRPVYWLMLLGVAVRFGASVVGLTRGGMPGLVCGGGGVLASLAGFGLWLAVEDDFRLDRRRVTFRLGGGRQGAAVLDQANVYADLRMWALAVLHLRAAVARTPGRTSLYVRLARGYVRLGRPDLARATLRDAQGVDPKDPVVRDLLAALGP